VLALSFLVMMVSRLVALSPCKVHNPPILFEATSQAADHNISLLREKSYDLSRLLGDLPFSVLTIGSEFRPQPTVWPSSWGVTHCGHGGAAL
jgi:hypothetical protein